MNAIAAAIQANRPEIVDLFLRTSPTSINAMGAYGNTAMHYGVISENTAIMEILLHVKYSPDMSVSNNAG
jgi:ankyrin repeat protein